MFKAYAAFEQGKPLELFEYDPGPLGTSDVEIEVISCGICHSDLSMLDNEWQFTSYPFVPGHEVIGKVLAVGDNVPNLRIGQTVGLGWFSESCMHCSECMSGHHNLCVNEPTQTIVGRHGGFADKVRCHWACAIALPEGLNAVKAGPLFCGGITVFNPITQANVQPTDRVGVVGIGGLGHMGLQFLNKWGCEVTAFTSSESKKEEALRLGAHKVVNSRNPDEVKAIAGSLNFIISTVNVALEWSSYIAALAPRGRLHFVGALLEPVPTEIFPLITGQKSISASPVGSPQMIATMLDFAARHNIEVVTEHFPMSKVNDAFEHLKSGNARYRIVLDNDWN